MAILFRVVRYFATFLFGVFVGWGYFLISDGFRKFHEELMPKVYSDRVIREKISSLRLDLPSTASDLYLFSLLGSHDLVSMKLTRESGLDDVAKIVRIPKESFEFKPIFNTSPTNPNDVHGPESFGKQYATEQWKLFGKRTYDFAKFEDPSRDFVRCVY